MEILRRRVYAYRVILVFYFIMVMDGGSDFLVDAQSRDAAVNVFRRRHVFGQNIARGPRLLRSRSAA